MNTITTNPGIDQHLRVEKVEMPEEAKKKLTDGKFISGAGEFIQVILKKSL